MNFIAYALLSGAAGYAVYKVVGPMNTTGLPGVANDLTLEGLLQTFKLTESPMESARFVTSLEEGRSLTVYKDSHGYRTIGIGFNMSAPGAQLKWTQAGIKTNFTLAYNGTVSITDAECDRLFAFTFDAAEADAKAIYPDYAKLGKWQKVALIGMVFQMGRAGVAAFKNTLAALSRGDAATVYAGVLNSAWARQTPARAQRAAYMLAYNTSHQDAENKLVALGRISQNERKYA